MDNEKLAKVKAGYKCCIKIRDCSVCPYTYHSEEKLCYDELFEDAMSFVEELESKAT